MKKLRGAFAFLARPLALAIATAGAYRLARIASIGAAYKAKILCSGIFVAHRSPASLLDEELSVGKFRILRYITATVDYRSREVTASVCGFKRTARFTPGFGSSLCYKKTQADHFPALKLPPPSRQQNLEECIDARLAEALEWAFSEPHPAKMRRTRAVVIVQAGKIVAERYAAGFGKDTPMAGWSMTKGVMNALVGIMVRKGELRLDDPAQVPEWQGPNDRRGAITFEQLLHMSSGLRFNEDYGDPLQDVTTMLFSVPDAAHYAASKPLVAKPATMLSYSSGSTNIISRSIRALLGDAEYWAFPRKELFERIGMSSAVMEPDASGTFVGSSFMYAAARDWAKFGQLYLQDGVWNGERILPEGWVEFSRKPAPFAAGKEYGAHFWLKIGQDFASTDTDIVLPDDAFHATGYEGQFVTIIPSCQLVIVRLGLTTAPGAWQHDRFVQLVLSGLKLPGNGELTQVPQWPSNSLASGGRSSL